MNLGCSRNDAQQLPEWTPADHDNQAQPQANQVDIENPSPGMPSGESLGLSDVVLATWKQNCVPCHGIIGRGDGPQAAATRPRDLTDPAWQRVAIDAEIIHTIKKGRGRMPAFSQIPDETLQGLVRLVRMLNASPPPASTSPSSSPSGPAAAPAAPHPSSTAPALPSDHPPIGGGSAPHAAPP
jgi:mono/diheme cytochrome c family protein